MYQKVIIVGYLGADPKLNYTEDGQAVVNFSVATTESWRSQSGEKQERTTWWRVSGWGKLAEVCNEHLGKGHMVLVEGQVIPDADGAPHAWVDQDGNARARLDLRASSVKFLKRPASDDEPPF